MKKSRIFLAATLVLGIAGAIATQANTNRITYYKGSFGSCTQIGTTNPCATGTEVACQVDGLNVWTVSTCNSGQVFKPATK